MTVRHAAERTAALVIVVAVVAGCGGESDDGSDQARSEIGRARIASEGSPGKAGAGATEGVPSLSELGRSGLSPQALGSHGTTCAGGGLTPNAADIRQVARATTCLLNVERKSRGLRPLRPNQKLASAAAAHARNMVRKSYFAHTSPGGSTYIDRIKAHGYLVGRRSWTVGENLAWGGGPKATPRRIVIAWMHSPEHRANILHRSFRDVGLGIAVGAPQRGVARGATYGSEFGRRGGS